MSLVESVPLVNDIPTTCNSLLSKQRCQPGDKDYIDMTEIVIGSSSSKLGEGDCCSDTSDYVTGNQTASQEIEQATKSCILSNNPPDVSGDHKRDALNDPHKRADLDSNFNETVEHIGVKGEIAKHSISGQTASRSIIKSRGPAGVCGSQLSLADVSCEQESTSRERGYGMLVPGFSLVLPRNTLISFCPHQSETFRDRLLKARARDTAGSQGTCTRQDRLLPQLATPQQATQIVQKKSVNPTVDDSRQPGKIVRSTDYSLFPVNLVLPVPSKEALQDSIGKGGNGIVTYIYHKRKEFAVKKTHFRLVEVDILCKLDHKNIVKLIAVMMGEEDPLRPHRYYCYHFYPRMSGDVQTYLNRLGQGALSNVLMKHKDSPSMLQLVVDNAKHILRSVLKGIHYLHSNEIVHSDIKRTCT